MSASRRRHGRDIIGEPLIEERDRISLGRATGKQLCGISQRNVLGLLDQPVVLGVEDRVHGGEADVLVGAAVAGDVVGVEQLVVVGAGWLR